MRDNIRRLRRLRWNKEPSGATSGCGVSPRAFKPPRILCLSASQWQGRDRAEGGERETWGGPDSLIAFVGGVPWASLADARKTLAGLFRPAGRPVTTCDEMCDGEKRPQTLGFWTCDMCDMCDMCDAVSGRLSAPFFRAIAVFGLHSFWCRRETRGRLASERLQREACRSQ
jgi:hypothetical protein